MGKAEGSWLRNCGFNPNIEEATIFHAPFIWINEWWYFLSPGTVALVVTCNPVNTKRPRDDYLDSMFYPGQYYITLKLRLKYF